MFVHGKYLQHRQAFASKMGDSLNGVNTPNSTFKLQACLKIFVTDKRSSLFCQLINDKKYIIILNSSFNIYIHAVPNKARVFLNAKYFQLKLLLNCLKLLVTDKLSGLFYQIISDKKVIQYWLQASLFIFMFCQIKLEFFVHDS